MKHGSYGSTADIVIAIIGDWSCLLVGSLVVRLGTSTAATVPTALTDELQAKFRFVPSKEWMVECTGIRSPSYLTKSPSVQFSCKGRILGTAPGIHWWQVLGQDFVRKDIGSHNHKGFAIGQPGDNLGQRCIVQDGHETLREDFPLIGGGGVIGGGFVLATFIIVADDGLLLLLFLTNRHGNCRL